MYIRRKVFSIALDEYGEERYFSTNEIINEDNYLNEEEHLFSNEDLENAALATAGAGAVAAGAGQLTRELGVRQVSNATAIPGVGPLVKRKQARAFLKSGERVAKKVPASTILSQLNLAELAKMAKEAGSSTSKKGGKNINKNTLGTLIENKVGRENINKVIRKLGGDPAKVRKFIGENSGKIVEEGKGRLTSAGKGFGKYLIGGKVRKIGAGVAGLGALGYGAARLSRNNEY